MATQPDVNTKNVHSWPPKAYNNTEFLNSPEARQIRVQCELVEPKKRFAELGIENTIIFFGSARIPDSKNAKEALTAAEKAVAEGPKGDLKLAAELRRVRAFSKGAIYHDKGVELARRLAQWSLAIENPRHRFYICTGGGPGMMEAGNHGAQLAGMPSIGLGISLPFEQSLNQYIPTPLQFEFHYFMIRKYWFATMAKAMVVLPGGFGTMDELFELLTLIQTHKIPRIPIVLIGSEFWNGILNFEAFLDWGMISPEDLKLFRIIDDIDEAYDWLTCELTATYLDKID